MSVITFSITTTTNVANIMNQSEIEAKTCNWCKARDNMPPMSSVEGSRVTKGALTKAPDWLEQVARVFSEITFDNKSETTHAGCVRLKQFQGKKIFSRTLFFAGQKEDL